MKKTKSNLAHIIKWEGFQVFFFLFFLSLLYFYETATRDFIGGNNSMLRKAIHQFLNNMQFYLLPDFFFFLFFPIMLISVSLIVFKKWRWCFLALTGAMISMLLIADRIYYSFFTSIITTDTFSIAGQAWDVKSAIFEALTLKDIFNISVFGIFVLFGIVYNKKMRMGLAESKITFAIDKTAGILFCLLAVYCYNIAFYIPKRYVTFTSDLELIISEKKIDNRGAGTFVPSYKSSDKNFAATFGIINFHTINFTKALIRQLIPNPYEKSGPPEHIYAFFDRKRTINHIKSPFYGVADGRNVFLIHFESLNPILIGSNVGGEPITPTLNGLTKTSLYWPYILDQITVGGSSDAEFEVITGMLPSRKQISAFNTSCMHYIPTLPKSLRSLGYQTISLHGYDSSFWNRNISHPLLGFETMYFKDSYNFKTKIGLGISDKEFFAQSVDLLQNHRPPFFAFLITLSSHFPYNEIPEEYRRLFVPAAEPGTTLSKYLQAIRYTDDAVGEFFSKIKNSGLWENSIFVIYGDHRPGMNKKMNEALLKVTGKFLTSPRFSCVPVIIVIPGRERLISKYENKYQNTVGGLYDIFPTIMHLLGYDTPFGVYGSHLFVENNKRDPAPFFRFLDSFVFNGIFYQDQGNLIFSDDRGIIFTNSKGAVIDSGFKKIALYKQALQSARFCDYILNSDTDLESLKPAAEKNDFHER